jgi:drug/metabolite transporter, DME family
VPTPDAGGQRASTDVGRAAVAVVTGAALWGTAGIAQELGAPTAAPPSVAAVRTLGGGAVLLLVALATNGWPGLIDTLRRGRGVCLVAVAAMAVFQLGYLGAVRSVGVAIGVLVAIGSAPAWAGLYDALRGRFPGWRWLLATILSVVAAGLLLLPTGTGGIAPIGIVLALIAGLAYATYAIASKHLLERGVAGIPVMGVAIFGGGLLLSPALWLNDLGWMTTGRGALAATWLALVAIGASYVAFVWGLARLPTPVVTTLTLTEPLVAALLAVVLLSERLAGLPLLGASLLVVGLLLVSVRPPTVAAAVPPTRG